jgi:hypothetical protein
MGFTADADGIDIAATLGQWQRADDERLFKIIVSPEFGERLDLKRLTHDLMTRRCSRQALPYSARLRQARPPRASAGSLHSSTRIPHKIRRP